MGLIRVFHIEISNLMARKHLRRGFLIGIVLLIFVALLSQIQRRSLPGSNSAETYPILPIGTNVWSGYEPLYLARSLGYFDDSALRLVEYSSASQVIKAFRNDAIQIAALTLDEALLLKEQGRDLRVIMIFDISHGADVLLAQAGIESIRDLRGKAIGVENTALGAYFLTRALQQSQMSITDVKVVPVAVDKHERAFSEKKVDAIITFDPVRTRLLASGAKQLFDSSQIPGEIVDVLVIHPKTLEEQIDNVKVILEGWFKALKYLRDDPGDASQRMADRLRLTPVEVLNTFSGMRLPDLDENISMLDGDESKLMHISHRLVDVMKRSGLLKGDFLLDELISVEPLKILWDKN